MTFTDTRAELAEAASTVPGVTGFVYRPAIPKEGQAWPLLSSADRGPGDAFSGSWRLVVCLGGDEAAASRRSDTVLPELAQAIDPVAFVQQAIPVVLPTTAGDMFALELICLSE